MKTYAIKVTAEECYQILYVRRTLCLKKEVYEKLHIKDILLIFVDSQFIEDYKYGFFAVLKITDMQDKIKKDFNYYLEGKKIVKRYEYDRNVITFDYIERSPLFQPLLEEIEPYVFSKEKFTILNFGESSYTRKEHNDLKVIIYVRDIIYNDFKGQYKNKTASNNIAALIIKFVLIPDDINYYAFIKILLNDNKEFWYDYPNRTVKELRNLSYKILDEMKIK